MEKKIPKIEKVFKPEEVVPRQIVRDIFINGMSQFWEHAKTAARLNLPDAIEEAKNNFFRSMDGILSRNFEESENLTRNAIEQFEQYRDRDWMNEEFMNEMTESMGRLVKAVRAEKR